MKAIRFALLFICFIWAGSHAFCYGDDQANARYDQIQKTKERIEALEAKLGIERDTDQDADESIGVLTDAPTSYEADVPLPAKYRAYVQEEPLEFNKEHAFELSSEISYITYEEPDVDMKETGPFMGLYAAYTYRPQEAQTMPVNVLFVDAHLKYGYVKYESPDGVATGISDYMFEPRLRLGREIRLFSTTQFTPYAVFGFRFLYDDFGSAGGGAYDRRSQYFYMPFGAEWSFETGQDWRVALNGEYDLFLLGYQTSYFSQIREGVPNLKNRQTEGYGLRGSIKFIKEGIGKNYLFEPYVRYWHIQDSKVNTATGSQYYVIGYEPENTSMEIGVRLGVQF